MMKLQNLIMKCNKGKISGSLINMDFEKAFDSIEWSFIYKAFKYFNFPDQLVRWIQTFYHCR